MITGTIYKKEKLSPSYDTIIIGSGPGGLTTAALLAQKGQKVLVLEKHYTAGGFTHTFKRKRYEWDVGVHYIGEVNRENHALRRIFDQVTAGKLKWDDMGENYDTMVFPNDRTEFQAPREKFEQALIKKFPQEEKAIKKYIQLVREVSRGTNGFVSQQFLPGPLRSVLSPLFSKNKFISYSQKTTQEVMEGITSNQELIGTLVGQWGDYGLPPGRSSFAIHALVAKHYFNGGNYPTGGASNIAKFTIEEIEKNGGHVFTKAGVKQILFDKAKSNHPRAIGVELECGDQIFAKTIVSGVGHHLTFNQLIKEDLKPLQKIKKAVNNISPSQGHLCLYLGLKGTKEELNLPKTNFWIYPSVNHDKNVEDYIKNPEQAPLPLTYVSFPSVKDSEWQAKKPEINTIQVITFGNWEWFEKWKDTHWNKRGDEYDAFKKAMGEKALQTFLKEFPHLEQAIDYMEVSTPLSTRHFSFYKNGEIYGLEASPHRFKTNYQEAKTPVKGLYFVGQDTVTVGIGGAISSGVITAISILGFIKGWSVFKLLTPVKRTECGQKTDKIYTENDLKFSKNT